MPELRECPTEVMDNNGLVLCIPEIRLCPCGGTPEVHFIGNAHTKKQTAVISCSEAGCFFEQRAATLHGRHATEWLLEVCLKSWNHRPTEQALREKVKDTENAHAQLVLGLRNSDKEVLRLREKLEVAEDGLTTAYLKGQADADQKLRARVEELEEELNKQKEERK